MQRRSLVVAQIAAHATCAVRNRPRPWGPERRNCLVDQPARFAWYELLTTNLAAASDFYGKVVGWGATDASTPELTYTVLTVGDVPVGGLMELPEEGRRQGATPRWVGYVAVDDIDATA